MCFICLKQKPSNMFLLKELYQAVGATFDTGGATSHGKCRLLFRAIEVASGLQSLDREGNTHCMQSDTIKTNTIRQFRPGANEKTSSEDQMKITSIFRLQNEAYKPKGLS